MPNPIKSIYLRRVISVLTVYFFFITSLNIPLAGAQDYRLPAPGVMVHLSPPFAPPILKGIKVHPDNPFRFDFILDQGDSPPPNLTLAGRAREGDLKQEAARLIKYFLASLTVPEDDLWVNLSPYEKNRIIPDSFGLTEMGRDLLAEDYMLKQITASLIYPEDAIGKKFWKRIYEEASKKFGTTNIPVNTFNKVWIVPQKAVVYENAKAQTAYVVESKLKVMLEQDYVALQHSRNKDGISLHSVIPATAGIHNNINSEFRFPIKTFGNDKNINAFGSKILREIVIPQLTKEVNEDKNFARLRQVYQSLILATWYKKKIKDSILNKIYSNRNKVAGVNIDDPQEKEKIYQQYLMAFKKGVYNYIKEERDPLTQETIPRKYFSGGETFVKLYDNAMSITSDQRVIQDSFTDMAMLEVNVSSVPSVRLDQYIPFRNVSHAQGQGQDIKGHITSPEDFKRTVEEGAKDLEPAKIDSLITRQAPIEQSILELISNESDAITGRSSPIGRFGVGGFQMLAFVLDQDLFFEKGNHIVVDTKTKDAPGRRITYFKGEDGKVHFYITESQKATTGTRVHIQFPKGIDPGLKANIERSLQSSLNLFTKMRILLNGNLLNPLDNRVFLNGDRVHYEHPGQEIRVTTNDHEIIVEGSGSGMSDDVILNKYLIPRLGENQDQKSQTRDEIEREVHLFYRGPQYSDKESSCRLVFQVSGINIQSAEIQGYNLPRELVIQLPSSTQLSVSRDRIEIDETTHLGLQLLACKIIQKQPIHQIALINGLMQAARVLDQQNTRKDALKPLVDTAKEEFFPFVMAQEALLLPNDSVYRQLETPANTLFLDKDLIYKISANQIPNAQDLGLGFKPGTFKKGYLVSFKEGAKVTFIEYGPYLLINRKIYERFRDTPTLLNLRLNYYIGYGERPAPRGWILSASQQHMAQAEERQTQIDAILDEFPLVKEYLSPLRGMPQLPQDLEPLKLFLAKMEEFIGRIPEDMRPDGGWIAEAGSNADSLAGKIDTMVLPDQNFLQLNRRYFLNTEHPERLERYLTNLLDSRPLEHLGPREIVHAVIANIDKKGIPFVDHDVFTSAQNVFKNKNLEGWEEAFRGINQALPYIEDEQAGKRLILRWLRLYHSDPKSLRTFEQSLNQDYVRPIEQPYDDVLMSLGVKQGYVDNVHSMGFTWQGKDVLSYVDTSHTFYLLARDQQTKKVEPLAEYTVSASSDMFSRHKNVFFSGEYDHNGNPLIFFSGHLFKFDLETASIQPLKEYSANRNNKEPGSGLILPLGVKKDGKSLFLISKHSILGGGVEACVIASFNKDSLNFEYNLSLTQSIDLLLGRTKIIKTKNSIIFVAEQLAGNPGVYLLDYNKQEIRPIVKEEFWSEKQGVESVQLLTSDDHGNLTFAGQVRDYTDLIFFTVNTDTGRVENLSYSLKGVLSPEEDIWNFTVVRTGEQPVIAVITHPQGARGHNQLKIFKVNLQTGAIEHLKTYEGKIFGSETPLDKVFWDDIGKTLVVATHAKNPPVNHGGIDLLRDSFVFDGGRVSDNAMTAEEMIEELIFLKPPTRSGFEALDSRDDLQGLPPWVKMIARFLKEEHVALVQEETSDARPADWTVVDSIQGPISLALLNYFYDKKAKDIQSHTNIDFQTFLKWLNEIKGADIADYIQMIRSGIKGQDKTQRSWVREIAIQNARDAIRRAREQGELGEEEGEIAIRNFTEGDQWIFSARDTGTGMNLWHLIRYFFPLDQSSKHYLQDSGNLGQGNYTLFADFDRVFLRTSIGDGIIHEIEIERNESQGPVITKWEVLKGNYKGTEVRRIKKQSQSDPQLESLFIQGALQKFGGAIQSPKTKRNKGLTPDMRDVRYTYNGQTFSEPINILETMPLGGGWGDLTVGRGENTYVQRVAQDGIFIKTPDGKEFALVPLWLQMAFERFGGMHIGLPRRILLNIPRTGYAQEHKFLPRLQVALLHGVMKTVLRDYLEKGAKIPGEPAGYYSNNNVQDNPIAQQIVLLMYEGHYDQITEEMLAPFLKSPKDFFELLSYVPFVSNNHKGEASLNLIREKLIAQSGIREGRAGLIHLEQQQSLGQIFGHTILRGAFGKDIELDAGGKGGLTGQSLGGFLGELSESIPNQRMPVQEEFAKLPPQTETIITYLSMRFLKPIVGKDMPSIRFYSKDEPATAYTQGKSIYWNLANNGEMFRSLVDLSTDQVKLSQELQKTEESVVWQFLETLIHESQHLPKFERPGDHTHHDAEKIDGFDSKSDARFGVRMGMAIDELLFDLGEDILGAFSATSEEMTKYITANKAQKDSAMFNVQSKKSNEGGIDFKSDKVNGAFTLENNGGGEIKFNIDPAMLKQLQNAPGFVPVIINIQPIRSLRMFLGLGEKSLSAVSNS